MKIDNLVKELENILNDNDHINTKIDLGTLLNNNIMDCKIDKKTFERYKGFLSNKNKSEVELCKEYIYNDLTLFTNSSNSHICKKNLNVNFINFEYNDNHKYNNMRFIIFNFRVIDNVNFPSLSDYSTIEEYTLTKVLSKNKNCEIIVEFKQYDNYQTISFKSKIDQSNMENYINSIQYLLSKFYMNKVNIDK